MSGIQDHLQISRVPLDKWSVREQLCLVAAVSSSGDQNWLSVSHALKALCGNMKNSLQTRPVDWFSHKNCAVQYGHLLEVTEIPKSKKASSDNNSDSSSPVLVETSIDTVLTRLKDGRIQEIEVELKKDQEEYAKLYNEIKAIQCEEITDDQLLRMWNELEKDQEMQRIEEMKLENQMREREIKKQELQRNWSTGTNNHSTSLPMSSLKPLADTTAVDMDVEDIIGTGKTIMPLSHNTTNQIQSGTAPLLSSLLKSPSAGTAVTHVVTSPSVRNSAPTITTLLTSGSIPNQNKPAIIPSHDEAVHLLTRPLSGPPSDTTATPTAIAQTLLSPSQSAPTLSMLLEKNKICLHTIAETKSADVNSSDAKLIENQNVDSNNESVPMDIEEELIQTKVGVNTIQSDEIDETDPNEEQQLLEVFKNIGNIEELDIDVSDVIDEEVDFLKGGDEGSPIDENIDIQQKLDSDFNDLADNIKVLPNKATTNLNSNSVDMGSSSSAQKTVDVNVLDCENNKIEIISSDDSNDNIPLSTVASLESSKERLNINDSSNEDNFLKDQVESAKLRNELNQVETPNESADNTVTIKHDILHETVKINRELSVTANEPVQNPECNVRKCDVFLAPFVEETKQESILKTEKEDVIEEKQMHFKKQLTTTDEKEIKDTKSFVELEITGNQIPHMVVLNTHNDSVEKLAVPKIQPPPSISTADTDENSSSTDISIPTRKDDKQTSRGLRKSPHEKTDDENPNVSTHQMVTPNVNPTTGNLTPRPTVLRKLRDRDRSESPMVDDDATTHSDQSTTNQRSRRRYSSTPVIDSVPNSPASSDRDERELRTSKKSLLSIYNVLFTSKYSATIQRVLNEESSARKLDQICLRYIDFLTIKKNIESGIIRSLYELQRDILWMCQNALMITKSSSASFKTILQFQQECQYIREFMVNGCEPGHKLERETRDNKSNSSTSSSSAGGISKGRSGSRKSLRLS